MKQFIFIFVFISQFFFGQKGDKFFINDYIVTFPKKVKLVSVNENSGQLAFDDGKKFLYQVSIRDANIMEFYNPNFNQTELLEAFYKWDFDYWKVNPIGAEVTEIRKKIDESYILWKVKLVHNGKNIETLFLYGIAEDKIIALSLLNRGLNEETMENALVSLYKGIQKANK